MMSGFNIFGSRVARPRRHVLRAIASGLLMLPFALVRTVFAERPVAAFRTDDADETIAALIADHTLEPSDKIRIAAADLAENGAVVPIKIEANFENVTSISIVAVENPVPLVAKFYLGGTTRPQIATRIKLAASGAVVAVVETEHGIYRAEKEIEVTIGGCGV